MKKQDDSPYGVRRMKTVQDRLRFAIDFAQVDLAAMREGSKMNLRDDLFLFAHSVPYAFEDDLALKSGDVLLSRKDALRAISHEVLNSVRIEFLNILRNVILTAPRSRFAKVGTLPTLQFFIGEGEDGCAIIFAASVNPRDVLIFRLMRLLESSANTKRLQSCPECGRIYIKVKRQKYCSGRCATRAYMREYRAENREAVSKNNHRAYEKRTKKRLGNAVKVGERRKP